MTDKEKIRAEIERLKETHERNLDKPMERGRIGHAHGYIDCCDEILDFIDSLPEETNPIPSPEEAMKILNEKIALRKKNGSWEGTDAENCARYIEEDSE